jgi:heme exporter protein A
LSPGPQFDASLEVRGLGVARGGELIVAGASFRLDPGGTAILRGPNGSGKTSVLRALAGLLPAAAGVIALGADSAGSPPSALRRASVYCGHEDGVKAALTGAEQLRFWCALYGAPKGRGEQAAREFSLQGMVDRPIHAWSVGQRRRLVLSRLLIAMKPIWLLDEPTAGMDARSQAHMQSIVERHRARGGVAVIATHDRFDLAAAANLLIGAAA